MKKKKRGKDRTAAENTPNNLTPEEIELLEPGEEPDEIEEDSATEAEILDPTEESGEREGEKKNDKKGGNFETLYKEALDRHTRTLAEFDNFRKRSIKEKAAQYDDGARASAEKLLPLIDNFGRAMQAGEATHAEDTFYQGIALIARQFNQVLTDLDIEEIPADPGTGFDPNLHNAVAHTEDENFGPNQIAEVLQKGYKHKEKILRHSMVKVAN